MEIGSSEWNHVLIEGGEKLRTTVGKVELQQLTRHAQELIRWNAKTNLTAITDPIEIAIKHILDSIAPLPHISQDGRLLDIGSGGGFPGLVLKIFHPQLEVTLIEASRKKASFLSHVIQTLGLRNVKALHTRAESLAEDPLYSHFFNFIVSRALCDLSTFVTMALPLLAPGGKIITLKGRSDEAESEMAQLNADNDLLFKKKYISEHHPWQISIEKYQLPFLNAERSLVKIGF
jgi:16S rRNA (guanine527-N7)-methyltransferase